MSQQANAPVSVACFMEEALYDPEQGYYTKHIGGIGRRGDFSTLPAWDTCFADALWHWILGESVRINRLRIPLIEVGAGDGSLMNSLVQNMGWLNRLRMDKRIVEISKPLQSQQKALLGGKVRWHQDMESALKATGGRAIIYANELLDAFPCHVLEWRDDAWKEIILDGCREILTDHWSKELQTRMIQEQFELWAPEKPPVQGQRIEVAPSIGVWLDRWSDLFTRGSALFIDYGDWPPRLYHRRPAGSLRAYFKHMMLEGADVFARRGQQDITCDVNFAHVEVMFKKRGWTVTEKGNLIDWLDHHCPQIKGRGVYMADKLRDAAARFSYMVARK